MGRLALWVRLAARVAIDGSRSTQRALTSHARRAPSIADTFPSLTLRIAAIRGIRSYIATHTYFSSTPREYELHDCEITMKTPRPDPKCRLLVYVPSAASALEPVTQPKGVLVHFHGGGWSIW